MDFPREWEDDQSMNVLFSPFRERRVNPASFDKKMRFWSELIISYCQSHKKVSIDMDELPKAFERRGKSPACLSEVCENMIRTGHLMKREDLKLAQGSSWASWGFDVLVKKPASWAFGALVKTPMTWTFDKMTGTNTSSNTQLPKQFIVTSILKERADLVFLEQQTNMEHERTDCIIGFEELYRQHKALIPDKLDLHLVLIQLCNDNKCVLFETENQEKCVRFAKKNKRSVTPPSDCDTKIYKLKLAEATLKLQIEKLSSEMTRLRTEAKQLLNQGQKQTAKSCLRKKKRCERILEQKENSLDNIHHIITAVQQADSNKMVLDAYSSGNAAFKQLQSQHGLDKSNVDDVMIDLEQTFEDNEEMNRSMASLSPSGDLDPELADLEEELDAILAEAEADDLAERTRPADLHSPGGVAVPDLSGLANEPAGRVPHQELLDSMCRMSIQPEDVRDTELFELPDAPTFDPSSPNTADPHTTSRHRTKATDKSRTMQYAS